MSTVSKKRISFTWQTRRFLNNETKLGWTSYKHVMPCKAALLEAKRVAEAENLEWSHETPIQIEVRCYGILKNVREVFAIYRYQKQPTKQSGIIRTMYTIYSDRLED